MSSVSTAQHSGIRLSYSHLTDPPLPAKGRMLLQPFTDHHPGAPQGIVGIRDRLGIAREQSLARTLNEAFAEASRFAGYEVKPGSESSADFQPDVVVEGDIESCEMGTSEFAGMFVTTQRITIRLRMTRPGNTAPMWSGRIVGSSGNFLSRNAAERLATYETMFRDSIDSAMREWVETLNPGTRPLRQDQTPLLSPRDSLAR